MKTISELMSLDGRTALVTGAGGGLGRMMSWTLAELGCDLILLDKSDEQVSSLVKEILEVYHIEIKTFTCDLESQRSREKTIFELLKQQKLNILVNNAAFVGSSDLKGWVEPFELQSLDTWRRALEVNLTSAFHLIQACSDLLKRSRGSIINIGSIYGEIGPDWNLYQETEMGNPAAYATSKGGLIQLTRWLSTTLAPEVRVNCISPGGIFRNQPQSFLKKYISKTPLKRMGIEEDFKGILAYLATDLSSYATGQNFIIDGGYTLS